MSGHTPGTWWVNPLNAQVDALPSLVPVCHLLWPTDERTEAETAANARLIAAAPDLLEALRTLMEGYEARMGDWENADFNDCYRKAEAAIAKATGESA